MYIHVYNICTSIHRYIYVIYMYTYKCIYIFVSICKSQYSTAEGGPTAQPIAAFHVLQQLSNFYVHLLDCILEALFRPLYTV